MPQKACDGGDRKGDSHSKATGREAAESLDRNSHSPLAASAKGPRSDLAPRSILKSPVVGELQGCSIAEAPELPSLPQGVAGVYAWLHTPPSAQPHGCKCLRHERIVASGARLRFRVVSVAADRALCFPSGLFGPWRQRFLQEALARGPPRGCLGERLEAL